MTEPTEKTVTFEVTFTVSDPAALREAALQYWLAGGGIEADFIENEQREDAIEDTPVGTWILALFDHPREYGPGFAEQSHRVDSSKFYQSPPLPKGFDPATSVSGAQIAKLMTVALESDYWSDLEPVLPERFKSLVTNPIWYADPALYETQQPWYSRFQIANTRATMPRGRKSCMSMSCTTSAGPTSSQRWPTLPKIDRAALSRS